VIGDLTEDNLLRLFLLHATSQHYRLIRESLDTLLKAGKLSADIIVKCMETQQGRKCEDTAADTVSAHAVHVGAGKPLSYRGERSGTAGGDSEVWSVAVLYFKRSVLQGRYFARVCFRVKSCFSPLTHVTAGNILGDEQGHGWPPIMTRDEFDCSIVSVMSG
jgi:hypothetical protein